MRVGGAEASERCQGDAVAEGDGGGEGEGVEEAGFRGGHFGWWVVGGKGGLLT